ncbi:MAG: Flp pilus assembly protein CpaB [Candidatus Omnitrophota bacterium]|nr:Flp pilus assembly protein CpaB [Candidatus Omnitrophota bacterium]
MPPFDKKKLQVIVIAVAMGLVAIFMVNKYTEQRIVTAVDQISRSQLAASYGQGLSDAVVAVREIPRGQAIDKNMITIKQIPNEFVQPGTITKVEALVGKMAAVDILPGEQVTASKLGFPGGYTGSAASSVLSLKTPSGKRAVTIPMDYLSAAGGMVRVGDYVDIVGNFPVPMVQADGKTGAQLATVTLFQNVLVLAIGGQTSSSVEVSSRTGRGEVAPAPPPPSAGGAQTITFALPPKEAELLLFASQQGKLTLILRSPLDTGTSPLPVATWDALLQYILTSQGQQNVPVVQSPQQEAFQQKVLEIYKAGSLEKKQEEAQKEMPPVRK